MSRRSPHRTSTPRAIEFVDSLPKNISGKIRRNELREREMKKYQSETNNGKKA